MPVRVLGYPFRVGVNGRAVTVEQGSEAEHAQELAGLILTRRGERPLVPLYGTDDPTFAELDRADLVAAVELYGPDVDVVEVTTTYTAPARADVRVTFAE